MRSINPRFTYLFTYLSVRDSLPLGKLRPSCVRQVAAAFMSEVSDLRSLPAINVTIVYGEPKNAQTVHENNDTSEMHE